MLRDKAILDLPAGDIGAPNDPVQGRFVFAGNLAINPEFRSGFLVGGQGAALNNTLQQITTGEGVNGKGFFIDAGGGPHVVTVEFRGWQGAEIPSGYDADGNPTSWTALQWGNTGDPTTSSYADATGEHPLTQLNTLEQYLRNLKIDSGSLATLQYGEFSETGKYSPLDVVIESPQFSRTADMSVQAFDGTITFIEAAALDDVVSAVNRSVDGGG